jgi:hypothetical protein
VRYPDGILSTLAVHAACDDMGAVIERLRAVADAADSYEKYSFHASVENLFEEMTSAMYRGWSGLEEIIDELK